MKVTKAKRKFIEERTRDYLIEVVPNENTGHMGDFIWDRLVSRAVGALEEDELRMLMRHRKSIVVRLDSYGETYSHEMSEFRWVPERDIIIPQDLQDGIASLQDSISRASLARRRIMRRVGLLLDAVTTEAQLAKVWPEAAEMFVSGFALPAGFSLDMEMAE